MRRNLWLTRPPLGFLNGTDSTFNDYLVEIGKVCLQTSSTQVRLSEIIKDIFNKHPFSNHRRERLKFPPYRYLKISSPSSCLHGEKWKSWTINYSANNEHICHMQHFFALSSSSLSVNLFAITESICARVCLTFYICARTLAYALKWVNSEKRKSYCISARTFVAVIELIWVWKRDAYQDTVCPSKRCVT